MTFDGPVLGGRWRLGPRMGHGAQADTYLARDEKSPPGEEHVVVVKQLHLARRASSSWKPFELFEREVRTLKSLRHPGIPRFVDSFESEPGVFNLIMERAPGATLWAYRKKVRFNDDELRDILVKALDILAYLHALNPPVVHRDIKPTNLVRSARGHVSLIDFGGVRDALRLEGGSTVIGTFGYMAPEQLHGEASPATDLYGLGATLIALAGDVEPERVPRVGLRMNLAAHLPHMEPRLRGALAAMVAPDPDDRPSSAARVLDLLRSLDAAPPRPPATTAMTAAGAGHPMVTQLVDEIAEFTAELPGPLRLVVRTVVVLIGVAGYLGVMLLRLAILPIAFAIASSIAGREREARVAGFQRDIESAVDQARGGMRALVRGQRRPELPPAPSQAGSSRAQRKELRRQRRRERRRGG
ncbi:MAG TPA: serine/threonine-protein kinase [Kofleriaceae bacterium]|nr:serine/threonine-protein kinase [Kofleriaceae bacterium]